ncbi:unnamed protein product [Moneuplotes crassus]|uniref:Uncharacterized protein n=1 Tax=Euplotes crassus TaxID=5936 RepID=A0AAD1XUY3_EUPCR|nr:unnamed protein product [Moneuplotes crassus]
MLIWSLSRISREQSEYFLRKLEGIGLERVKHLTVEERENGEVFKRFFKRRFVKDFPALCVRFDEKCMKQPVYYGKVLRLVPRVTQRLILEGFDIDKTYFRKLIQSGRHIRGIEFIKCSFNLKDLTLSSSLRYFIKWIIFRSNTITTTDSCNDSFTLYRTQANIEYFIKASASTTLCSSLRSLKLKTSIPQEPILIMAKCMKVRYRIIFEL